MADDAADRAAKVLASGYIGEGKEVAAFEDEFAVLIGCRDKLLMVNSCTSAITLALHLCGVGPNDYVIATPQTCTASVSPVANLHAHLLWADVDPDTGLIDPNSVKDLLRRRGGRATPKAIIAVDWGGAPCDYGALRSFGIPVIQDAAHRVFTHEHPTGDYITWSHQAIKHITCGDGGTLRVPPDQYDRARLLRWYGLDRLQGESFRCSQNIQEIGYKFQSNNIAAAIGRANLEQAQDVVCAHRVNARMLGAPGGSDHWFYSMKVNDRAGFTQHMADRGIVVSQVHRRCDEHDCFRQYRRDLPGVDEFSGHNIGLPTHSLLSTDDVRRIREALEEWNG